LPNFDLFTELDHLTLIGPCKRVKPRVDRLVAKRRRSTIGESPLGSVVLRAGVHKAEILLAAPKRGGKPWEIVRGMSDALVAFGGD
jgi:hypothetical protein